MTPLPTTHRVSALSQSPAAAMLLQSSSPPSPPPPSPPPLRRPLSLLLFLLALALLLLLPPPLSLRPQLRRAPPTLEEVLARAVTPDGTVILTTLNGAWAAEGSVVDLFLESFRIGDHTRGLLRHLVIVALDEGAYVRCAALHPHCYVLEMESADFSGEKDFMTDGYLRMMWRRIEFLRMILEKGYNFIFTDTDVLWFRNPLPYFYADTDFQIACDHFMGVPHDLHNRPNGGFKYVRSNNRTIQFYKFWYASRLKHPGYHDQDVLNFIKRDPFLAEIGLQMRFLNTARFGGLCEPSKDFNKVCTMHVNCCIGLQRKLHDLRVMIEDWRGYMSLPLGTRASRLASWSVPQKCSLAPLNS